MTPNFTRTCNIVKDMLKNDDPLILVGHAGVGKNEAVYQVCAEMGMPVVRINSSGDIRSANLFGRLSVLADGKMGWQDGLATFAVKEGCVLIVDEINSIDPDILFPFHGLLDEGRMTLTANSQIITKHPDFRFVATMNPCSYFGTKSLNQALVDRFFMHEVEVDPEIDAKYIERIKATPGVKRAFQGVIKSLREKNEIGEISQYFGHRTMSNVVRMNQRFGLMESLDLAYCNKLPSSEVSVVQTVMKDFVETVKSEGTC
jgi:cobaltochelatase CobS